ncbi:hypothetical protein [Ruminococcus sp.]|uniref:hypothetical protein n=1 Tax=Ruminococcus sp. TaxID=41978 RepID=UPI0025E79DE9|nr:hypothetical protein [Ruminococcus sp.]
MNLVQLYLNYTLHDSVITDFFYSLNQRYARCVLSVEMNNCNYTYTINFEEITLFKIEAQNADFIGNELIDIKVSSDNGEYFKAFFSEGFAMPGKVIEIRCDKVNIYVQK